MFEVFFFFFFLNVLVTKLSEENLFSFHSCSTHTDIHCVSFSSFFSTAVNQMTGTNDWELWLMIFRNLDQSTERLFEFNIFILNLTSKMFDSLIFFFVCLRFSPNLWSLISMIKLWWTNQCLASQQWLNLARKIQKKKKIIISKIEINDECRNKQTNKQIKKKKLKKPRSFWWFFLRRCS